MDTRRSILTHLMTRPMSLSELAAATGVSLPTLRRAVKGLVHERWIREAGLAEPTGGRPAQLYGLDGRTHTVVGVHFAHPGMRLVATDITGRIVDRHAPSGVVDLDPESAHAEVVAFVERMRRRHPKRDLVGVGVATPGYVDPQTGTVIAIGRVPHWNNLPVRDRLRVATGLPVTIGNDMDALATAEFGLGEDARAYAYVGYGEGVKFTLFLDGAPYVGPFGNAGLVGPRLLAEGGGDEEARLLKVGGVVAAFGRDEVDGVDPAIEPGRDPQVTRRAFLEILRQAEGDSRGARIVGRMADVLGAQIASFVHLVQPELVVVGGALAGAPSAVLERIEAATRRRLPTLLDNSLMFREARVTDEDGTAVGATRVFMQRFLRQEPSALGNGGA